MITRAYLESKMNDRSFRWASYFLLAGILFLCAEFGRLLGLENQNLSISLIWPATGFSLAALLLFGFRIWPGILLGNLAYNFFYLSTSTTILFSPLIVAGIISIGSLLQALVGGYILRRFSSYEYFTSVKDVILFLLPASFFSCLIGSSIGAATLYYAGIIPENAVFINWLTFLIGDTFGIYITTPLLVVWLTHSLSADYRGTSTQALTILCAFLVLTWLLSYYELSLWQFYIPLTVWATYRYRMHGATLSLFLISVSAIIPTVMGFGAWDADLAFNELPLLIVYLATIETTCLILAAVLNDRAIATQALQEHNINLKEAVTSQKNTLDELGGEIVVKEKLASLGLLTLNVAKQLLAPMKEIFNFTRKGRQSLLEIKTSNRPVDIEKKLSELEFSLDQISKFEKQALKVIDVIEFQYMRTAETESQIKNINLHILLNECLEKSTAKNNMSSLNVVKHFDRSVSMLSGLPEDLSYAFLQLLNNALQSMRLKKERLGLTYEPVLTITTINHHDRVEVIIHDNGLGVSEDRLDNFFYSFMKTNGPEMNVAIGLALAHDIIVHVHHGELKVSSKEGESFQLTLVVPVSQASVISVL